MKPWVKFVLADGTEMEVGRDVLLHDAETKSEIAAGDVHPDRIVLVPGEREEIVPSKGKLVKMLVKCLHRAQRDERDWKRDRKFYRDGSAVGVPSVEAPLLGSARKISKAWQSAKHSAPPTLNEAPKPSEFVPPGEVDRILKAPRRKIIAEPAFDKVARGSAELNTASHTLYVYLTDVNVTRGAKVTAQVVALLRDDLGTAKPGKQNTWAEFGSYTELEEGVKYAADYLARLGYTVWR